MEFAGNKETENFARNELGLELVHQKAGEGNTEFLFRPVGASNYWNQVAKNSELQPLNGNFTHDGGHAWRVKSGHIDFGDAGSLMIYENGSPIGWPNAPRSSIQAWGAGRYCIDQGDLIFSATDNKDPNAAGKEYAFRRNFL